jgi:uncharacterized protein YmfQ (DUF2313 family)
MTDACQQSQNQANVCNVDLDGHLRSISDLLPQGRAWPRDEDSNLMRYWKAFAEVVKYAEDRICALSDEFFCDTADETLDVWYATYDLRLPEQPNIDAACLDPGYVLIDDRRQRLCGEVTKGGGNDCAYLVGVATGINWAVTCTDIGSDVAGCFAGDEYAGCAALGLTPEPAQSGSSIGVSTMLQPYGAASSYPGVEAWEHGNSASSSPCGVVPGSPLGIGVLGDGSCNFSGYFEVNDPQDISSDLCSISAQAPRTSFAPALSDSFPHCVEPTGEFLTDGTSAHHIKITIDWATTIAQIEAASPSAEVWCLAGCAVAGDECVPVAGAMTDELVGAINEVKPAHVEVVIEYA